MTTILNEIVSILIGALNSFGTGLAGGINGYVTALFVTGTGEAMKLTTFGGMIAIFAGISLCIGITTKIWIWLTSLGANK